jgi:hypothetical protein
MALITRIYLNMSKFRPSTNRGCPVYVSYVPRYISDMGSAMAQAVSRRPLTAEARVRSRVCPSGICGEQSGTGTGFFPEYFGFPLSILFHRCSITRKNGKKN